MLTKRRHSDIRKKISNENSMQITRWPKENQEPISEILVERFWFLSDYLTGGGSRFAQTACT